MKRAIGNHGWPGKALAGLVFGFLLALGASGLLRRAVGIEEAFFSTSGQVSMWLMAPVWSLVVSLAFLFSSAGRCCLWLAGANAVLWGVLMAMRP